MEGRLFKRFFFIIIIAGIIYSLFSERSLSSGEIYLLGSNYYTYVKKLFRQAQKKIIVCIFLIKYEKQYPNGPVAQLLNELIRAKKRGVKVLVIMDKDFLRNDMIEDNKNKEAYLYLRQHGVEVKYDSLRVTSHLKVIVIDDRFVIIGSTNWTYSALRRNNELSICINSPQLAVKVQKYIFSRVLLTN